MAIRFDRRDMGEIRVFHHDRSRAARLRPTVPATPCLCVKSFEPAAVNASNCVRFFWIASRRSTRCSSSSAPSSGGTPCKARSKARRHHPQTIPQRVAPRSSSKRWSIGARRVLRCVPPLPLHRSSFRNARDRQDTLCRALQPREEDCSARHLQLRDDERFASKHSILHAVDRQHAGYPAPAYKEVVRTGLSHRQGTYPARSPRGARQNSQAG